MSRGRYNSVKEANPSTVDKTVSNNSVTLLCLRGGNTCVCVCVFLLPSQQVWSAQRLGFKVGRQKERLGALRNFLGGGKGV